MFVYGTTSPHMISSPCILQRQWEINNGKCGVCGDPWDGSHSHEPGGIFYSGQISQTYTSGQEITIDVEVTANHLGWFEFRLCPNNVPDAEITQDCLDQYVLPLKYHDGTDTGTRCVNNLLNPVFSQ